MDGRSASSSILFFPSHFFSVCCSRQVVGDRHMVGFLGCPKMGPGLGVDDPVGSLAIQDIL